MDKIQLIMQVLGERPALNFIEPRAIRKDNLMNNTILIVGIGVVSFIAIVLNFLPQILRVLGYHPKYKKVDYDLQGKKALLDLNQP